MQQTLLHSLQKAPGLGLQPPSCETVGLRCLGCPVCGPCHGSPSLSASPDPVPPGQEESFPSRRTGRAHRAVTRSCGTLSQSRSPSGLRPGGAHRPTGGVAGEGFRLKRS